MSDAPARELEAFEHPRLEGTYPSARLMHRPPLAKVERDARPIAAYESIQDGAAAVSEELQSCCCLICNPAFGRWHRGQQLHQLLARDLR